jgi:site-specific recombinase XerC
VEIVLESAEEGRNGVRNYAIICTLLDSGIRNSELRNLRPDDLSLKTGQIKIQDGKGSKGRTVVIGKRAKKALWRWMMQRPEEAEYLFCTEDGNKLRRVYLRVLVGAIGKRVGVHVNPHKLRHTFALMYLKMRGDPFSLQYLLGHEDMTTVREYVKVAATDVADMYRSPLDALND